MVVGFTFYLSILRYWSQFNFSVQIDFCERLYEFDLFKTHVHNYIHDWGLILTLYDKFRVSFNIQMMDLNNYTVRNSKLSLSPKA